MVRRSVLVLALLAPLSLAAQVSDPVLVTAAPYSDPLPAAIELHTQAAPLLLEEDLDSASDAGLDLRSAAALVIDQEAGKLLYAKNTDAVMPEAQSEELAGPAVIGGIDL